MFSIEEDIRKRRDGKLKQSDWTQLPDSPITVEKKAEWATYRQALRDMPQNQDLSQLQNVGDANWPAEPS